MKTILVIAIAFVLFGSKCHKPPGADVYYPLYLENNSHTSVFTYLNNDMDFVAVYPDTGLTNFPNRMSGPIKPFERKSIAGGRGTWQGIYDSRAPNDTLSVFIFEESTISSSTWDSIRRYYRILQRYDLSLTDLENRNFTIEYPFDIRMGAIKVFK